MSLDLWGNEICDHAEVEEKIKSKTFFDCVNAISYHKEVTPELLAAYNPFMVNKAFQQNKSTVQTANYMNILNNLPVSVQYNFYRLMMPRRIGKSTWAKKMIDKDLENLLKLGLSYKEAQEALYVLTPTQLSEYINVLKKSN